MGVIPPFCNMLVVKDAQVVQVVLDGISNILKVRDNSLIPEAASTQLSLTHHLLLYYNLKTLEFLRIVSVLTYEFYIFA